MRARVEPTRAVRGAFSGTLAALIWAAQQPLDKALFASEYDDVELLGKMVTQGARWYPIGLAMHGVNGALFGAVYSNVAPSIPVPAPLRGAAAALFEHFALWPLGALSDRLHPAREELPALSGNRRAFYQAIWRHVLFGLLLGELERRLNAAPEAAPEAPAADYSSNGHGRIEHAVSVS